MVIFIERKVILSLLFAIIFAGSILLQATFVRAVTYSYSIELEEFRWNKFPLKVFVNMNQWSIYDYAIAVHEALGDWLKSIWNYTHTYTNTTLQINYLFYVKNVNSSSNYDIIVSFAPNELSQNPNTVGLTTYRWEIKTHIPQSPIMINITTYSATADHLFVKNVAMHELGHALGLGHTSSASTTNGPELMYPTSSMKQIVYPSTLDVYGLTMLYEDNFGLTIQLPSKIPYIMLELEDNFPFYQVQTFPMYLLYPSIDKFQHMLIKPQEILYQPMILLIPSTIWMVIALAFGLAFRSGKKGTITAIAFSTFIAYYIAFENNLVSLSLKILLLLPAILIGSTIAGFIGSRFSSKKETQQIGSF